MTACVPPEVTRNLAFLSKAGIWHLSSHNHAAFSCADAARKRRRLAHSGQCVGIPLCDELKTAVYVVMRDGGPSVAIVHCRGHQFLDEVKLVEVLGGELRRMRANELEHTFGLGYGLVTPFAFAERPEICQVFDWTVLERFFAPGTMMTNLGHHEFGVEFHPSELFDALPNTVIADIAQVDGQRLPVEHTMGILTGNGSDSGRLLWGRLDERIRSHPELRFRGDISLPRVIVESIPAMGLSMELEQRLPMVRAAVLEGVRSLCERGVSVLGLACNTTQCFVEEIRAVCEPYGARFISIAEATASELQAQGVTRVVLLGIDPVCDLEEWSDFKRIAGEIQLDLPSPDLIAQINELAFLVKQKGVVSQTVNLMRDIVRRAVPQEDTVVLVALTELSLLVAAQRRSARRIVDTLEILANGMADVHLEERARVEIVTKPRERASAPAG